MDKEKEEADEALERAERAYDRSVSRLMATCKQLHVVVSQGAQDVPRVVLAPARQVHERLGLADDAQPRQLGTLPIQGVMCVSRVSVFQ